MKQKYFFWGEINLNKCPNTTRKIWRLFISYDLPVNLIKWGGKYDLVSNGRSFNTGLSSLSFITYQKWLDMGFKFINKKSVILNSDLIVNKQS